MRREFWNLGILGLRDSGILEFMDSGIKNWRIEELRN
jgi:hypothetical protein